MPSPSAARSLVARADSYDGARPPIYSNWVATSRSWLFASTPRGATPIPAPRKHVGDEARLAQHATTRDPHYGHRGRRGVRFARAVADAVALTNRDSSHI